MAARKRTTKPDSARRTAPREQPSGRSARLSKAHLAALAALDALPPPKTALGRVARKVSREALLFGRPLKTAAEIDRYMGRDD